MNEKELEKMELELEELKKACGGNQENPRYFGMRYERWEKSMLHMIRRLKEFGYSYERAKDFVLRGENPADFEQIIKWLDEIYRG